MRPTLLPKANRTTPSGARMSLSAPPPFRLEQTVLSHGWYELAPFRWDPRTSTLTRAERLPDGSIHLLRIRQSRGTRGRIRVELLTGPVRPEQRRQLGSRIRRMLNLGLDLSEFTALCRREPRLKHVPRAGAGRFLTAGNLYEDVFKAICCTNIAWKQAVAAVNRVASFGRPIKGTACRAFPTAQEVLNTGSVRLAEVSRLGYRVPYLLSWAERVASHDPDLIAAEAGALDREALRHFFLSVRGVGKTSCRYLLMMRGIADEIPIDSSVFLYCRENRFGGRTPTERQIRRLYDKYGAWKAYAYWFEFLVWARNHWSPKERPAK